MIRKARVTSCQEAITPGMIHQGVKLLKKAGAAPEAREALRDGSRIMERHLRASDQFLAGLECSPGDAEQTLTNIFECASIVLLCN